MEEGARVCREAIILAGGFGTRLGSVSQGRQKVTAEVAGAPMALRLALWLGQAGVERVIFAAGHRADDVQALAVEHGNRPPRIVVAVEPEPLGTGGAARFAAAQTQGDAVLVLNGDSLAEIDLRELYAFHRSHQARVTLALAPSPDVGRYGVVRTDADGAVVSFDEKPGAASGPAWINAGIYVFERSALLEMPEGRRISLERETFPGLVGKGLYAMGFDARFIDIGTPESLSAADAFFGGPAS